MANAHRPQPQERPTAAFVLSLIAGLWMLVMGGWMWSWGEAWGSGWSGLGPGMMGPGGAGWMWGHGLMLWAPWLGALVGIVVLVGAAALYARPEAASTWGIVIVVASAVNLFLGMGGLLASVLGIIGGAIAAYWRPQPS